ncbi:MBL fold metallo-hydrolase [Nonomuraea sp. NPDC050310]|uniref:MBL fold metallo-hydrolase n=1 Tax=Nonomuraea sp. NPDC050310 TaxID=3154935 RepID=UPI0033E2433E
MTVLHLNCGTMRPAGAPPVVCHCLVVETAHGLALVDTGLGRGLGLAFRWTFNPDLDPAETMPAQLRRLGYAPSDVRDIVLTHLDLDHAGSLHAFPDARVHLHGRELDAARRPATAAERRRYQPATWAHGPLWRPYTDEGDLWYGLRAQPLDKLDGFALVPLPGHTRGHSGVAVRTGDGWLLHAGDAYFFHGEIADPPYCPPAHRLLQRLAAVEHERRLDSLEQLRRLPAQVRVFSAHDATELARDTT